MCDHAPLLRTSPAFDILQTVSDTDLIDSMFSQRAVRALVRDGTPAAEQGNYSKRNSFDECTDETPAP